jgi:hypothetical protein
MSYGANPPRVRARRLRDLARPFAGPPSSAAPTVPMPLPSRTEALRSVNARPGGSQRSYWAVSRAPRYSFLFALPLLVLYELLAAALSTGGTGIRNGADVLVKRPFELLAGEYGAIAFGLTVITVCMLVVVRDMRRTSRQLSARVFAGMFAESVLLAMVCGVVVGAATAQLLGALGGLALAPAAGAAALALSPVDGMDWTTRLMVSLGAGLYEELLFRVLLVSAIAFVGRRVLGLGVAGAGVLAAVLGALLFSGFHYVGQYGDPFTLQSFVFRALAGLFFSALYLLRGFGIAAWTHALYDVMILLL